MFGYITINKSELKVKEYDRYHSFYCGLCKVLKDKYGRVGQMTLTYDMTFLVILLTGLYELPDHTETHRCIAHPQEKHPMLFNEATDYAADMNILLTYHNCMDDWFDDRSLVKLSAARVLEKKYRALEASYPRQTKAMVSYMEKIRKGEAENSQDLDLLSGCTGELLGELFVWKEDEWADILRQMGFYMGKFIYLMDAWDDLKKDQEKKHYNPWKHLADQPDLPGTCHRILTMMMAECARNFEKLPILQDAELLRNILYSGVWARYNQISETVQN
ncbi:MAG: DUF5685 family protein [Candidatus Limivivens sp.]|nr:DUF5685 family protein [Candidatus Limivivens sp.]